MDKNGTDIPATSPCLVFLSLLYFSFFALAYIFSNKEMNFFLIGTASPGSLMLPLCFIVIDIVTEVYGYQIAKQVIWITLTALFIFSCMALLLSYLPDPGTHISAYTPSIYYRTVFTPLPEIFLFASIGYVIGIFVNAALIAKWKFMLKGRYFWLRSLGSSTIGEFIFTLIGVTLICVGHFPLYLTIQFIISSYLIKLASSIVYTYPAAIITGILKKRMSPLKRSHSVSFNPFSKPFR